MIHHYTDVKKKAEIHLIISEADFERQFLKRRDDNSKYYTIAWNKGADQKAIVDEVEYVFSAHSMLPFMVNQSFSF